MKSVYVAARDFERANDVMEFLRRELGYVITYDWTKLPKGCREQWAAEMMVKGVEHADAVVLCDWDDMMLGALLEVGIAIGLGKPVVLFGEEEKLRDSLFWTLPNVYKAESWEGLEDQLIYGIYNA